MSNKVKMNDSALRLIEDRIVSKVLKEQFNISENKNNKKKTLTESDLSRIVDITSKKIINRYFS